MHIVNVDAADAAKANLSRLIEWACASDDVVIARNNEPMVKLVSIGSEEPRRQRGSLEGQVIVHDTFFDPLSPEELDAWGQ